MKFLGFCWVVLVAGIAASGAFASPALYSVYTDLEPDDLVAIYSLVGGLRKSNQESRILFVVGEGDAFIKKFRMEKLLAGLRLPTGIQTQVMMSSSSDEANAYDGMDCLSSQELEEVKRASANLSKGERQALVNLGMKALERIIKEHSGPQYALILKPLRDELPVLARLAKDPAKPLKELKAYVYEGRFNISRTIEKDANRFEMFRTFLSACADVPTIFSNYPIEVSGYPTSVKDYMPGDIRFPAGTSREDQEKRLAELNTCAQPLIKNLKESPTLYVEAIRRHIWFWNLKMLSKFGRKIEETFLKSKRTQAGSPAPFVDAYDRLFEALRTVVEDPAFSDAPRATKDAGLNQLRNAVVSFEQLLTDEDKQKLFQEGLIWSVYSGIARLPESQFTLADYHPVMGLFHPEYFELEVRSESLGPNGTLEKSLTQLGDGRTGVPDLGLAVRRALSVKASFCEYLAPLISDLEREARSPL